MIVIISAEDDVHAKAVIGALKSSGQPVRVLNLAAFPLHMALTVRLSDHLAEAYTLSFADGTAVDLEEVRAVWWRRPQPFTLPESITNPAYRHFTMSEAATAFQGMWQASRALWVNDIMCDAAASHKVWQLALAKRIGLAVPETVITNSPSEAQHFWASHPDQVIYKPFSSSHQAWRETRLLRPEEQSLVEAVRYAPVIFQRYVPAVVDLRITVVGSDIFAAEAHSQQGEYRVDVRFNRDILYKSHRLPVELAERLLTLMRTLGLEYGAIDMRLTPDGEYVFLEINPAGQFLFVEVATGLPIAAALAAHLAHGRPSTACSTAGTSAPPYHQAH